MREHVKIGTLPAGASVYVEGAGLPDVSALRIVCTFCGKDVRTGEEPALLGVHGVCQPSGRKSEDEHEA